MLGVQFSKKKDGHSEYRIESSHGCKVVYGLAPMAEIAGLLNVWSANNEWIIGDQIAKRLGATLVAGPRQAIKAWEAELGINQPPAPELASRPLKEQIDDWFKYGERGTSSEAIAYRMLGHSPEEVIQLAGRGFPTHPNDPDDFRRCHLLIQRVPGIHAKLDLMRDISPVWSALVDHWDELTNMLEDALASEAKTAPEMYEKMKSLGC